MSFVSYIIPQIVARFSTKYNEDIRVVEESGKLKLLVNGSRQSGTYVEWLWKKALDAFRLGTYRSILVLGVGGGTVIHLLAERFSQAHITGVDIDPQMIEIGKKYFGLSRIPNLRLVVADAKTYKPKMYDLVIIDLFVGRHIPEFVRDENYLKRFGESIIIINYLREGEYWEKSVELEKIMKRIFRQVKNYQIAHNSFYFVVK